MAIDMEVLSINPFWYGKDRDTASQIVKKSLEIAGELCIYTNMNHTIETLESA